MEQPAPRELKRLLLLVFEGSPFFQRMEIFNPGHEAHGDGSAIDIFVNAHDERERRLGDRLVQLLVERKPIVRWGAIIWNRQTWDRRPGPVPYERAATMPHTDHVHVEWGPQGRMTPSFPALEEALRALRAEFAGAGAG